MTRPSDKTAAQPTALECLQSLTMSDDDDLSSRADRRRLWLRWAKAILACVVVLAVSLTLVVLRTQSLTPSVEVIQVRAGEVPGRATDVAVLTATGYIVTRQKYIEVGAIVAGRIIWIGADEGDPVRQGQVLARIDARELRAENSQATAALAMAQSRLEELRAGARPQEVEQAHADVAAADAKLTLSAATLQRSEQLFRDGVISAHEMDVARSEADLAQATRRAAVERYALVKIGPRQEAIALAAADVARARAVAEQAAARLDDTVIRAPFEGVLLEKLRDQGDFVVPGGADRRGSGSGIFRLAANRDLHVEVDVSESSLARLKPGQHAVAILDAWPARTYHATLVKFYPSANRQKGTVKVELRLLDADGDVKPEMSAKVQFIDTSTAGVPGPRLMIPAAALIDRGDDTVVFVLDGERVHAQVVRAGSKQGGFVEITAGLKDGQYVVTNGHANLEEGRTVRRANP